MIKHAVLVLAISASSISTAQEISNASTTEASSTVVVPANTEVVLRLNDDLSTKGGQIKVGHMFNLTVAYDVKVRGVVAIPAGAVAKGEVTMRTGKGVFGKSGKMQIEMRSVDLDNQRIPLTGKYQQEGEGNTLAAVGAILLSAPLMFVTGKSAIIPRGKEISGYTMHAANISVI